jgi:hypothetical protein
MGATLAHRFLHPLRREKVVISVSVLADRAATLPKAPHLVDYF